METEELTKLVDDIYKNILEKFNPGARQMINAGKAYLKALHGAAAASRLYVDAITKLARQAQQGTWGGSSDIGAALMKIVEVYREIQEQQMNILKAFYVDLLVPLETNLEKDTKVVQSEQKKFLQQHKQRSETYSKAAAMMKKQRKKSRGTTKTGIAMDKELKNMQVLEEEKTKLDAFCEQSLKTAMTQERRRYGFVLERQCSLAKHYISFHNQGLSAFQLNIEEWNEIAKTREFLPETVENMFTSRMRQVSFWPEEDLYSNPRSPKLEDDRISIASQLRKTKSMDASCLDIRSIGDASSPMLSLSRAKSDFNLTASTHSLVEDCESPVRRPKSIALPSSQPPAWDIHLARALYAYLSSGENQLSFLEGDVIALMGERNKGWQFGENLRTQCNGWFPLAYTEILDDPTISPQHRPDVNSAVPNQAQGGPNTPSGSGTLASPSSSGYPTSNSVDLTPRLFGDTLHIHRSTANAKQIRRVTGLNNYIPPPALPAPVPTPQVPYNKPPIPQSQSTNSILIQQYGMKHSNSAMAQSSQGSSQIRSERPPPMPPLPMHLQKPAKIGVAVGNVSLHSSNDSGFSNDPPPQPEADYSDDENPITKIPIRKSIRSIKNDKNNNKSSPQPSIAPMNGDLNDKTTILKRTKSFWRFGRYTDHEILEGMSMWKHRDLIDVEQPIMAVITKPEQTDASDNNNSIKSDRSVDSDKTIHANDQEINTEKRVISKREISKRESFHKKSDLKFSLVRKESNNEFYDDEGDGLLMRTVNRKDILKQYDSSDIESDSELISDDPYDCIVVNDHQKRNFPNVAEIGKKLEQFSKTHQNHNKDDLVVQIRNKTNEKEELNKNTFTTFGINEMKMTPVVKKRIHVPKSRDANADDDHHHHYNENNAQEQTSNSRQFLPRTKLTKTNSNQLQVQINYDQGNIYGPWYDLWGLDATVSK